MSVNEFCGLCISEYEKMKIYSVEEKKVVFYGTFDEAMYSRFADDEVFSFEVKNGKIVINV